jgi:hypothetical protein
MSANRSSRRCRLALRLAATACFTPSWYWDTHVRRQSIHFGGIGSSSTSNSASTASRSASAAAISSGDSSVRATYKLDDRFSAMASRNARECDCHALSNRSQLSAATTYRKGRNHGQINATVAVWK